mgnify:CR=1 FL=1
MGERFLYSDIPSLRPKEGEKTINDCFREELEKADQIEISVGFSSFLSLKELDRLVTEKNIKNISVILGMYFFNGFPKPLHQLALEINKKWKDAGIGEIRLMKSCKYHGKLYCFMKDKQVFSAIIGSANLSFLIATETTRLHQYEIALLTDTADVLQSSLDHIQTLKSENISENIGVLEEKGLLFVIHSDLEKEHKISKVI